MIKRLFTSLKAVAILVAVICLGLMAHGGIFTQEVLTKLKTSNLDGLVEKLLPLGANALIAVLFLSISYLFYKPARNALVKTLDNTGASPRGKTLLLRSMQSIYWVFTVFVVASVVAPEVLSKLFLGVSIISAALALSLQGVASDLICGIFLQMTKRFQPGDNIQIIGMDVKGKVVDIGYLSCVIKVEGGNVAIPNRDMWAKPTKVNDPPKSTIIIPTGTWRSRDKT